MPHYVCLMRMTPAAATAKKPITDQMKECTGIVTRMGGKIHGVWMTLGQYDFVAVVESPDDITKAAEALAIANTGYVTVETLRAFDQGEVAKIQAKLTQP